MRKCVLLAWIVLGVASGAQAQAPKPAKDFTAHVVGYAHIDLAWLWRWEESVHDIMFNTFGNQLRLMDKYPDFTFAQDQAVVFEMMERYYPDIYKGIIQRVKTRNWIPVSSTWVQMDENMPDGESLVRQFLYGQKYSKEKFGRYVRVAWQPDVFGHPYTMPQIARKAGIEFYLWGRPENPERPPVFWWQGLDGTRVVGYNMPGWYNQPMDKRITEVTLKAAQRVGLKDMLVLYGEEDHGGGPNPKDADGIAQLNASPQDVRVKPTNVDDYLDLLRSVKTDLQVLDSEHNPVVEGCYTTQVEMKRNNRRGEQLLLAAEKMSELATFFRLRDYYPTRDLTEAWKLVLLNQFHDLLAGSSIGPVYDDAARQYQEVMERGRRALNFSLEAIGRQLETRGEGIPLVVYNSQSWDRTDLVTAEIASPLLPEPMVAVHGAETIPVQIIKPATREGTRQRATVAFVAQKVPQMGLKLYRILSATSRGQTAAVPLQAGLKPRPYLENEFLRVEFNPSTGNIARLYDKQNKREAFRGEGNSLVGVEDTDDQPKPMKMVTWQGSAWDLGLTGKQWDVDKALSVEVVERGPARATIRVVRRFGNSEFTQDVSLIAGAPRVDVEMFTDWQDRNILMKAVFPVQASANKVAAEIPYGVIEREPTGLEMVMGKWVDISDKEYGVAILNNGRHGFDAKDNTIRVSVIRGPTGPDPRADEGIHSFGYSIYPHRGGWREGKVVFQGLAFNSPLMAFQEPQHHRQRNMQTGAVAGLPEAYSFIKTDSDHVILYAMKQMEGFYDTDAILRFFETEGREGEVKLQLDRRVRVVETDLLEDTMGPVGEGQTIQFRVKPWEIKTLRLTRVE